MKTFELKLTLVAKTDEAIEHIEDIKHMILSGELQRDWVDSGKFDKVKATVTEVKSK